MIGNYIGNKTSGIYKIQSKIKPERIYIGSASYMRKRWLEHLRTLRNQVHHSKKLQRHFNKYGKDDLIFTMLLECDKDDLIKTEQYFLDSYQTYFNNCKIAGSCRGMKVSEDLKRRVSEANKGHKYNLGKRHCKEAKERMRIAKLGKKMKEETRQKMIGRTLSEETKQRMSIAQTVRWSLIKRAS